MIRQSLAETKAKQEKMNQHRFFFWYKKENRDWIRKRLTEAKRPDLLKRLLGPDKKESHQRKEPGNKTMPKPHGGHRRVRKKS